MPCRGHGDSFLIGARYGGDGRGSAYIIYPNSNPENIHLENLMEYRGLKFLGGNANGDFGMYMTSFPDSTAGNCGTSILISAPGATTNSWSGDLTLGIGKSYIINSQVFKSNYTQNTVDVDSVNGVVKILLGNGFRNDFYCPTFIGKFFDKTSNEIFVYTNIKNAQNSVEPLAAILKIDTLPDVVEINNLTESQGVVILPATNFHFDSKPLVFETTSKKHLLIPYVSDPAYIISTSKGSSVTIETDGQYIGTDFNDQFKVKTCDSIVTIFTKGGNDEIHLYECPSTKKGKVTIVDFDSDNDSIIKHCISGVCVDSCELGP